MHDGRPASAEGLRKRVVYLDTEVLAGTLSGPAVDRPSIDDPLLRQRIHQLHLALADPGEAPQAESRLVLIGDRLRGHLGGPPPDPDRPHGLAGQLGDLLDAQLVPASPCGPRRTSWAHPTHLVRAFSAAFGLPPRAYLTSRRLDRARRLLLAGQPAGDEVALGRAAGHQARTGKAFRP